MKKRTILIKVLAAGLFLSLTLFHPDSLRAAAGPERLHNLDSQASITDNKTRYNPDRDWSEAPEEKHDRFAVLEWLIREKLMEQYQKMDFPANLDVDN